MAERRRSTNPPSMLLYVDLDAMLTPLGMPPPPYPVESAERFTPLPPRPSPARQSRHRQGQQRTTHQDSERRDDGTGVYMINAGENSWTGALSAENDSTLQASPIGQRGSEEQANSPSGLSMQDRRTWQKDLLLRNIVRRIKRHVEHGAIISIERCRGDDPAVMCGHPFCSLEQRLIQVDTYFCVISLPQEETPVATYCLICLESLWKGHGMVGTLPNPNLPSIDSVQGPAQIPNVDGCTDEGTISTWVDQMLTPVSFSSQPEEVSLTARTGSNGDSNRSASPSLANTRRQRIMSRKDTPSNEDRLPSGSGGSLRRSSRIKGSATKTQLSPDAIAPPSPSTVRKKQTIRRTAETIGKGMIAAEAGLRTMYKAQERLLASLQPGQKAPIRLSRGKRDRVNDRLVSIDAFGIVYTDLLGDTGKSLTRSVNPGHFKINQLKTTGNSIMSSQELDTSGEEEEKWCECNGRDDGREMIECSNQKCYIGWYHLTCLDEDVDLAGDWLCVRCRPKVSSRDAKMPPFRFGMSDIHSLFAPPYSTHVKHGQHYFIDQASLQTVKNSKEVERRSTLDALHLDGYADSDPVSTGQSSFKIIEARTPGYLSDTYQGAFEIAGDANDLAGDADDWDISNMPETPGASWEDEQSADPAGSNLLTSETISHQRPVRFQHIAPFIRPGKSLDDDEKGAVELWKLASKEQLKLERDMEKSEKLQERRSGLLDDEDDNTKSVHSDADTHDRTVLRSRDGVASNIEDSALKSDNGERDEEALVAQAGVLKDSCYGKDLSAVLAMIRRQT